VLRNLLIAAFVLAALLAGSQIVLPPLAERRIADDLAGAGDVESVSVHAFPALKLLFDKADRVEIRMGDVRLGPSALVAMLSGTREVGELDARAASLRLGPLVVRDASVSKRGGELAGRALLEPGALAAALPPQVGFRPVGSEDGSLLLEATAGLFGLSATVRARLSARDGALVIAPEGGLLAGLATLTVFRDSRVDVTAIGARETPEGYRLKAGARLNR
jgi:hypothetical protein